jgi:FSR family fosmidomycin resistance protein-like MFS transporter
VSGTGQSFPADQLSGSRDASQPSAPNDFDARSLTGLGFAHAANDTYAAFLPPLLPALIHKLSLSNTQAGLIAFASSSPSLLQPFIGYLADRGDLRYLAIFGPAVAATGMSLLGIAPRLVVLALLVIVAGLGSAAFHAVAAPIAGQLSGRKLGRGMGLWMLWGTLGFAVGPLLVVAAMNSLSLEGTPWLMIGGWAASAVLFVSLRRVPAGAVRVAKLNSWRQGLNILRPIFLPVAGIILMRALLVTATFTFLPTYLTGRGAALSFAGVAISILAAAGMAGCLIGGSMSDRWGRRPVLFGFVVAAPILSFALLAARGWSLLPVLILLGATITPSNVIMLALVQEFSPDNRAFATGIYHALGFSSESVAAVAVGIVGDFFGLGFAIGASAILMLLSLPLVLLLRKAEPYPGADEYPTVGPRGDPQLDSQR